jgi:uncharacterized membrane protein
MVNQSYMLIEYNHVVFLLYSSNYKRLTKIAYKSIVAWNQIYKCLITHLGAQMRGLFR